MKSDRMPLGGVFHSALKFGAQAVHLIYISSFLHSLKIAAALARGSQADLIEYMNTLFGLHILLSVSAPTHKNHHVLHA